MGRLLKVAIRADGNNKVGFGHLVRCTALAKELTNLGCKVVFISKEKQNKFVNNLFAETQLSMETISNKFTLEEEMEFLKNKIDLCNIDIIILDGSQFNKEYVRKLKKTNNVYIVVLDVNREIDIGANIVINGGIYSKELFIKSNNPFGVSLLGPEYNLLRDQFKNCPVRNVNKNVKRLLITCGGGGTKELIFTIIESVIDIVIQRDIVIDLVLGSSMSETEELVYDIQQYKNINIHTNVSQMVDLMYQCDIAISAGGTTLYELAATGTPTLAFILANNQDRQTIEFHNQKTLINLGYIDSLNKSKLANNLNYLLDRYKKREKMSKKGQELIDGKGASRSANEIVNNYKKER